MWVGAVVIVAGTIVVLVFIAVFGLRERMSLATACAGFGFVGVALAILLLTDMMTAKECATNPCGNEFEVLWDQAAGAVVGVIVMIIVGVGLVVFAALFRWEERAATSDDEI